jgi:predicted dehydrogenase
MTERVRVGVIGTSWYADIAHLPRVKSHPGAELAAICGRNRARAEEMAGKHGIPLVFTDYRNMIEKGSLDALIVSTPDDLHYPMTMDALDAGLHVLCEKPLALNRTQAKGMYEKAEAARVKHMVCFTYRWTPVYRYLKQLVDEGYVGRCFHCRFSYLAGYGRSAQYGWKFDRRRGLGALGDLGSHMIDLARWYVGDIVRVSACLNAFVERPGSAGQALDPANDAAFLAVEFENGAQGVIEISTVAHTGVRGQDQFVRLYGQSGTLEADGSSIEEEIRWARQDEQQWQVLPVPEELWDGVDRAHPRRMQVIETFFAQPIGDRLFIDAILQDRSALPSFSDGVKAQEVIDAALQSHEQGVWVSLGNR